MIKYGQHITKHAVIILVIWAMIILPRIGYADANNFQSYQNYAKTLENQPAQVTNAYPAQKTIPGYTTNPTQEQYYGGVEQQTTNIDQQASRAIDQSGGQAEDSGAGNTVTNDFTTREHYNINPNNPSVQKGMLAETDDYDITHGISDQYVDCTKQQSNCKTTYHNETCSAPVNFGNMICVSNLDVTAKSGAQLQKTITITVTGDAGMGSKPSGTVSVDVGTGQVSTTNAAMHVSVSGNLGMSTCAAMAINGHQISNANTTTTLTQQPSCQNGMKVKAQVNDTSFWGGNYKSVITLHLQVDPSPTLTTAWVSQCTQVQSLVNAGICAPGKTTCTEGKATKQIDGQSITENCWQKTTAYTCQSSTGTNTCTPLVNEGCQQVGSTCTQKTNGVCIENQNTYQCPQQTCQGSGIVCGQNFFCLSGSCAPNTPTQNANMGIDATDLDAASQEGQDVKNKKYTTTNEQAIHIFTGTAAQCREDMGGFANCCSAKGWGININLAKCNAEEKALGKARQLGLAKQVGGKYCAHHVLGVCTEHREGWCYWNADIPYDVQIGGRPQVGKGWGTNKNPDCSGFTPDQVQKINFDKINFSNFEQSVINGTTVPSEGTLQQQIQAQVQQDINNQTGGGQ